MHALINLRHSFKASKAEKRLVRVYFDGEDWVHYWANGALVSPLPLRHPISECGISIPLFTYAYQPKKGDVILDVGAGFGTELKAFSEMVGSEGHVFAIEADPCAARCLNKLREMLGLKNVTIIECAIGERLGAIYLTQDERGAISNMVTEKPSGQCISVPVMTLDTLIEQFGINRINYLKMNIEGAEVSALLGFKRSVSLVRNWCVSCHDFLGTEESRTFEFVNTWLSKSLQLSIRQHPAVPGSPWMEYFLYASS